MVVMVQSVVVGVVCLAARHAHTHQADRRHLHRARLLVFPVLRSPILEPNLNSRLVEFRFARQLFAIVNVRIVAGAERLLQIA